MTDRTITMPHEWTPRKYQLPALIALDTGCRRVLMMHHRRAGKDSTALNWTAKTLAGEPTSALYLLPEFKQAKRVLFRELNSQGKRHVDQAFPPEIVKSSNETEGVIRLINDSVFQIGGFDSIDSYMGVGPRIVVMSEYATSQHGPRAWQLLQPILLANAGVAIFPYTPRGKNHGRDLYEQAKNSRDWHVSKLTVEDTNITLPDGERLVDAVNREVLAGVLDEEFARQEFWCSFEAPNSGSYYGKLLEMADQEGRVTRIAWDPALPVYTWWDIGTDDANVIWFVQAHRGGEVRFIDYIEDEGQPLSYYLGELNERKLKGWQFEPTGQLVPHDFASREYTTGESAEQAARKMGWRMTVVPATSVQEGIDAVRRVLPRCWFDEEKCKIGLDRMRNYTKVWSDQLQRFTGPKHDVNSHACLAGHMEVATMCGLVPIRNVALGEHVETPSGWGTVTASGPVRVVERTLMIELADGRFLRCTPEHKLFTLRGVVQADTLRTGDVVMDGSEWPIRLISWTSKAFGIDTRAATSAAFDGTTIRAGIGTCIVRFGRRIMAPFRAVAISTTGTRTVETTPSKILSFYPLQSTSDGMQFGGMWQERSARLPQKRWSKPPNGMVQTQAENGTEFTARVHGWIALGRRLFARSAGGLSTAHIQAEQNTVHRNARRLREPINWPLLSWLVLALAGFVARLSPRSSHRRLSTVHRCVESAADTLVYDLTVEPQHCYIANGMLVSNCDAFRTGVMGMRRAGMHMAKNMKQARHEGALALAGSQPMRIAKVDFSVWDR